MRPRSMRLLPLVLAILFLAGAAGLGVLQVRWLDAFSRAEEMRARSTLGLGVGRARADAEDEIRVLVSLVRLGGEDLKGRRWASLLESIRFWNESSSRPFLLKDVFIGDLPAGDRGFAWSREAEGFLSAAIPSWVRDAAGTAVSSGGGPGPKPAPFSPQGDPLVILPVMPESSTDRRSDPKGFVAVVLDSAVLYGKLLPSFLERELAGYPYRIVSSSDNAVVASSPENPGTRQPDITVGLDDLHFNPAVWMSQNRAEGEGRPDGGPFGSDPSMRFWLLENRMTESSAPPLGELAQKQAGAGPSSTVRLEVYYPNAPLSSVMHRRWILNLSLGIGILAILILSAVVLYRLYRQSARLRASEQEFVSSMSHELRTPLAVIRATSENLSQGVVKDTERLPRYARVINSQVKRLSAMVESILFYSGLESGAGRSPVMTDVKPAGLIDDVVQSLRPLAGEAGKEIRCETDGLPEVMKTDVTALRLIIENLLINAIRHSDSRQIRLAVSRRPFDILSITVEDDGPGIPPREQSRIFEPFVRGERSVRRQTPGSGLGLHLVRRVAAMLGGGVKLESPYTDLAETVKPGCRFTVTLPCAEVGGQDGGVDA